MSIGVEIYYPRLKELTGDPSELRLEGATVGECLDELEQRFPGARRLLCDERGIFRRQVFVHVNAESVAKPALDTPLHDGDRLIIAALAVGG